MKRSVAIAIVAGFKANGRVEALGHEICAYLRETYRPIFHTRIQSMVGDYCKRAADAIWDGHEAAAIAALMKFGLRDRPRDTSDHSPDKLAAYQKLRLQKHTLVSKARRELYRAAASGRNRSAARRGGYR